MGQRQIGYADALKILGTGDSKLLTGIDKLLGGAIIGAAAATGGLELLALLDVRDELIKQTGKLLSGLGQRVRGARGKSRTDLLVAAHAVVAVNAFFEALRQADLPVNVAQLELTKADQLAVAGTPYDARGHRLVEALIGTDVPRPMPHRPYEENLINLRRWYQEMARRLRGFVMGLAAWDRLDETRQSRLHDGLMAGLPSAAVACYEDNFRRLAAECGEFHLWMDQTDSAATRTQITTLADHLDTGLSGLQVILERLAAGELPSEWPAHLAAAYCAHLDRPIVEASPDETHAGLVIPSLAEGYVNACFRVAEYEAEARPAEEEWWQQAPVRGDLQLFLAAFLTSPVATEVPLVVLGQPGSGKSLLTKVLAARLPPQDYVPIRVELRRVAADSALQDQIEAALRATTGEQMTWPDLVRAAGDALPVVMLDGFDELLQATGVSRSDYLEQVRDFQRRELDQDRRVAVIVTSRIVVADRVRFPQGAVAAKLEPFSADQVRCWLRVWNDVNAAYLQGARLSPLPAEVVLAHRDLAEQPLLLLMLALYDADGNTLQNQSDELARADLYERLLTKFVARELDKHNPGLGDRQRAQLIAAELQQLSIVAFAMFNRGRKAVTEEDLDADFAALLPRDDSVKETSGQFSRRLTHAQLAVGRFFFLHRSQALVDATRLNEYEFLHATFGEYLVARLVFHTLDRIVTLSAAAEQGVGLGSSTGLADDDLWAPLSFTPLTDGSQTAAFLSEMFQRRAVGDWRARMRHVLAVLFRGSLLPRARGYGGYEPRRITVTARHAAYSANLVVLNVLAADGALPGKALFGTDLAIAQWQKFAFLWRSQLDPTGWDGLVNALAVTRKATGAGTTLEIGLASALSLEKPLECYRTLGWLMPTPAGDGRVEVAKFNVSVAKLALDASFLCALDFDLLVHALHPMLRRNPHYVATLITGADGATHSAAHATLETVLTVTNPTVRIDALAAIRRKISAFDAS